MDTTGPLEHVLRSNAPWVQDEVTECGRLSSDCAAVITRQEIVAKVNKLGQQRASYTTCMTCWQTASRQSDWDNDPVGVVGRDMLRSVRGDFAKLELTALGMLYRAHQQEYEEILASLGQTTSLGEARRQRRLGRPRG